MGEKLTAAVGVPEKPPKALLPEARPRGNEKGAEMEKGATNPANPTNPAIKNR